jgi:hypothetical protein
MSDKSKETSCKRLRIEISQCDGDLWQAKLKKSGHLLPVWGSKRFSSKSEAVEAALQEALAENHKQQIAFHSWIDYTRAQFRS